MKHSLLILFLFLVGQINAQSNNASPPKFEIVGNYYANNYSVFYPIGWSRSGQLAYIVQDVNSLGAAQIYIYDLAITNAEGWGNVFEESTIYNLEVDTSYNNFHQEYSDHYDTTHFNYNFMTNVYWNEHKENIERLVERHKIIRTNDKIVQPVSSLNDLGIGLSVERQRDSINAIRVDTYFAINITYKGIKKKVYYQNNYLNEDGMTTDNWGNVSDLLYYQIEGYIKSPYTDDFYLYIHEITMGFEEPAETVILAHFNLKDWKVED
ncbi:MAG: hypothetical protein H6582_12135 [Crocinitomicaceae bacterium]|nr:hypothetical protein [Crocinitomicaceae bacterium]